MLKLSGVFLSLPFHLITQTSHRGLLLNFTKAINDPSYTANNSEKSIPQINTSSVLI